MTKVTFASHPYLLGFEQLDRLVERTAKSGNDGYPPYNIEQRGDASYRITLALAGFAEDDLSITLENNQLVIRGRQAEDARRPGVPAPRHRRAPVPAQLRAGRRRRGLAARHWRTACCTSTSPAPSPRRWSRTIDQPADQRQENLKEAAMTDFPSLPADRRIGDKRIVYVREVKTADLPEEMPRPRPRSTTSTPSTPRPAQVLALVPDRAPGLRGRRQNEFSPVSVH